jgi:hypothetical protein
MTLGLGVILAGVLLIALVGLAAASAKATGGSSSGSTPPPAGSGSGALAPNSSSLLTSKQQQFAGRLQSDTGLDPGVIAAWVLAEESSGAAQARDSANNNDWLNIGYTDSATLGAGNTVWSSPSTAADATAAWIQGTWSDPGFGRSSSGVRAILNTIGQGATAQIAAIQNSGWASSGYPSLPALFHQVTA